MTQTATIAIIIENGSIDAAIGSVSEAEAKAFLALARESIDRQRTLGHLPDPGPMYVTPLEHTARQTVPGYVPVGASIEERRQREAEAFLSSDNAALHGCACGPEPAPDCFGYGDHEAQPEAALGTLPLTEATYAMYDEPAPAPKRRRLSYAEFEQFVRLIAPLTRGTAWGQTAFRAAAESSFGRAPGRSSAAAVMAHLVRDGVLACDRTSKTHLYWKAV